MAAANPQSLWLIEDEDGDYEDGDGMDYFNNSLVVNMTDHEAAVVATTASSMNEHTQSFEVLTIGANHLSSRPIGLMWSALFKKTVKNAQKMRFAFLAPIRFKTSVTGVQYEFIGSKFVVWCQFCYWRINY